MFTVAWRLHVTILYSVTEENWELPLTFVGWEVTFVGRPVYHTNSSTTQPRYCNLVFKAFHENKMLLHKPMPFDTNSAPYKCAGYPGREHHQAHFTASPPSILSGLQNWWHFWIWFTWAIVTYYYYYYYYDYYDVLWLLIWLRLLLLLLWLLP